MLRVKNVGSGDILSYYTDNSSASSNSLNISQDYSISDVKKEINKPVLRPRYRVFWLNSDESVKKIIPVEDILGGNYSENYQNGQRRSLTLELYNASKEYTPSINGLWAGVKLSYEIGLEIDDDKTIWFPKGVFVITNINCSRGVGEKNVTVELGDKFATLEGAASTLETSYTIPVGTDIESIIKDTLNVSKGNGDPIDPKTIIYHASFKGIKTQATINGEAGQTWGSIILDLATMLSAEVFYDIEGHLNFVPINEVTDDVDKPIIFQIFDENGDFSSNNLSFNMTEVINRVVVIGANVNGEACTAIAVNDDPTSPLCYQRIGYRTGSPINDSNITSKILAEERANYELRQKLILKSSVSTQVSLNPLLSVNNIIMVTDSFYGFQQEKFLIQEISYSLDYSGQMDVSTTNTRNLPFAVGG